MDLQLARDGSGFNVRAAGVAVRDGRLLLHWKDFEGMWTVPGGRVSLGETAEAAVARELREELGVEVAVRRLLWVVEHFFDLPDGRRWHQLGWYYEVGVPPDCDAARRAEWRAMDGTVDALYRWVPLAELASIRVSPSFLATDAAALPSSPAHRVYTDRLV